MRTVEGKCDKDREVIGDLHTVRLDPDDPTYASSSSLLGLYVGWEKGWLFLFGSVAVFVGVLGVLDLRHARKKA